MLATSHDTPCGDGGLEVGGLGATAMHVLNFMVMMIMAMVGVIAAMVRVIAAMVLFMATVYLCGLVLNLQLFNESPKEPSVFFVYLSHETLHINQACGNVSANEFPLAPLLDFPCSDIKKLA